MMVLVGLIFFAFIAGAIIGLIYLWKRCRRFFPLSWRVTKKAALAVSKDHVTKADDDGGEVKKVRIKRLVDVRSKREKKHAVISLAISAIPVIGLIIYTAIDFINGVVVIVNVLCIWLIIDFVGYIIKRLTGKRARIYFCGIIALVSSVAYLASGWQLAHNVVETDYVINTQKDIGTDNLRIVQIADSHLGALFDGDGFAAHMKTIQKTNPDLIVVTGDFVDDDTTKEDMEKSCAALGEMRTTYGTYFVYGNHDKGYYDYRDFTNDDLRANLERNHVNILEDQYTMINDRVYIIGRKDKSEEQRGDGRLSMKDMMQGVDTARYTIVLDHQPNDYDAQREAGVDLVFSGHTHGGQMIPVGFIGELSGANDKTYGLEKSGDTTFVVTSGIADWAIKYKTGTKSEFVVMDIKGAGN